ncbi:hypothetical protein [Streptomyces flavofungini]|uniref:hypothetical protein n=1 Tax=Streptomyces flavofungini TaxID=68200 RepID=UPI0034DFA4A6
MPTGRRRRTLVTVPASAQAVPRGAFRAPQPPQAEQPPQSYQARYPQVHQHTGQDPPIYRALIRTWADRGRTLPGHHDPEWSMLVAPPVPRGPFSASRDPRGDVR